MNGEQDNPTENIAPQVNTTLTPTTAQQAVTASQPQLMQQPIREEDKLRTGFDDFYQEKLKTDPNFWRGENIDDAWESIKRAQKMDQALNLGSFGLRGLPNAIKEFPDAFRQLSKNINDAVTKQSDHAIFTPSGGLGDIFTSTALGRIAGAFAEGAASAHNTINPALQREAFDKLTGVAPSYADIWKNTDQLTGDVAEDVARDFVEPLLKTINKGAVDTAKSLISGVGATALTGAVATFGAGVQAVNELSGAKPNTGISIVNDVAKFGSPFSLVKNEHPETYAAIGKASLDAAKAVTPKAYWPWLESIQENVFSADKMDMVVGGAALHTVLHGAAKIPGIAENLSNMVKAKAGLIDIGLKEKEATAAHADAPESVFMGKEEPTAEMKTAADQAQGLVDQFHKDIPKAEWDAAINGEKTAETPITAEKPKEFIPQPAIEKIDAGKIPQPTFAPTIPEAPELPIESYKLPHKIKGAKPNYGTSKLNFESDVDKALYIVGGDGESRKHASYVDFLKNDVGLSNEEIASGYKDVKAGVKQNAHLKGESADIPKTFERAKKTKDQKPPPKPIIQQNIDEHLPKELRDTAEKTAQGTTIIKDPITGDKLAEIKDTEDLRQQSEQINAAIDKINERRARPIEEQRRIIHDDIAKRMIAAGRSPEEADANAAIAQAFYETLARNFEGKLGTAEEMYLQNKVEYVRGGKRKSSLEGISKVFKQEDPEKYQNDQSKFDIKDPSTWQVERWTSKSGKTNYAKIVGSDFLQIDVTPRSKSSGIPSDSDVIAEYLRQPDVRHKIELAKVGGDADKLQEIYDRRNAKEEAEQAKNEANEKAEHEEKTKKLYDINDSIVNFLKQEGIKYKETGSNISKSSYIEFDLTPERSVKVRISDHALPPSYGHSMGYADFEFGTRDQPDPEFNGEDPSEFFKWVKENYIPYSDEYGSIDKPIYAGDREVVLSDKEKQMLAPYNLGDFAKWMEENKSLFDGEEENKVYVDLFKNDIAEQKQKEEGEQQEKIEQERQYKQWENIEDMHEKVQDFLDEKGIDYSAKKSGLSSSRYIEFEHNGKVVKLRFADHPLPPSYAREHGYPDFEFGYRPKGLNAEEMHSGTFHGENLEHFFKFIERSTPESDKYESHDQSARGASHFFSDGRTALEFLRNADSSTFIHEFGHYMLETFRRYADHELAPESMKQDAQAIKDWMGIKDWDQLLDGKYLDKPHEKFARAFEQYVMAGKAPTPGLASVFAKFKDWLLSIYKNAKNLNVDLNDSIRGVFDRLLTNQVEHTTEEGMTGAAPTPETPLSTEPIKRRGGAINMAIPKRPPSLVEWLKDYAQKNGGILDAGGDLKATLDKAGGFSKLVSKENGTGLDDIARAAREAGYFPKDSNGAADTLTSADLVQAVSKELSGDKIYSDQDYGMLEAFQKAQSHNDYIKELSNKYGIDTRNMNYHDFWNEVNANIRAEEYQEQNEHFLNQSDEAYEATQDWLDEHHAEGVEKALPSATPEDLEKIEREQYQANLSKSDLPIGAAIEDQGIATEYPRQSDTSTRGSQDKLGVGAGEREPEQSRYAIADIPNTNAAGAANTIADSLGFMDEKGVTNFDNVHEAITNAESTQDAQTAVWNIAGKIGTKIGNLSRLGDALNPDQAALAQQIVKENNNFTSATRGRVTHEDTVKLAALLNLKPQDLEERVAGDAANAQTLFAVGKMYVDSVAKLSEIAKSKSPDRAIEFAKQKAIHQTIAASLHGYAAEAGRALNILKVIGQDIGSVLGDSRLRDVLELEGLTLNQVEMQLNQAAAIDVKNQNASDVYKSITELSKQISGKKSGLGEAFSFSYISNFLSGFFTHTGYTIGAITKQLVLRPLETLMAGQTEEAKARFFIAANAIAPSFKAGLKAVTTGTVERFGDEHVFQSYGKPVAIPELPEKPINDSEKEQKAYAKAVQERDALQKYNDSLKSNRSIARGLETVYRPVTNMLAAVHAMSKSMAFEQNYAGEAYRQAAVHEGLKGELLNARLAELMSFKDVRLEKKAIKAVDAAISGDEASIRRSLRYLGEEGKTKLEQQLKVGDLGNLTDEEKANIQAKMNVQKEAVSTAMRDLYIAPLKKGSIGHGLATFANSNPILKGITPFAKMPANILNERYMQRTPLALLSKRTRDVLSGKAESEKIQALSASLVGLTDETKIADIKKQIKYFEQRNVIKQAEARGKIYLGTILLTMGAISAQTKGLGGQLEVTGSAPSDYGDRQVFSLTKVPESIKIGNFWVHHSNFAELGGLLAQGAAFADIFHQMNGADGEEGNWHDFDAYAKAFQTMVEMPFDESALHGMQQALDVMHDGSPKKTAKYLIGEAASMLIPYSSMLSQLASRTDTYEHKTERDSIAQVIQSKIPLWSSDLPPKYDIFGNPIIQQKSFVNIADKDPYGYQDDPVIKTFERLGMHPSGVKDKLLGISLNEDQYAMYQQAYGKMMRERMEAIVTSDNFGKLTPDKQREALINADDDARLKSKNLMLAKFPNIRNAAVKQKNTQ